MHSIAWHSMAAVSTMQRRQAALWGATCRILGEFVVILEELGVAV